MTGRPAVLQAVFPNNVALGPLPSGTCVGRQGEVDDTAVEAAGVMIAQRMANQRLAPSRSPIRTHIHGPRWRRHSASGGSAHGNRSSIRQPK